MNSLFHAMFLWLSAIVVSFKKSLWIYLRKTWLMQACVPVVSWSLYFWKSIFSFRADSILKSDTDFILNWMFPDCVHFFGAWARQAVLETIAIVYEHTKRTQEMCSPIGHNNIRSWHLLEFLEMVGWESVPRGSSAHTWKLSSRLFSQADWLPLGLRGCSCSNLVLKAELEPTVIACLVGRDAQEVLYTGFAQTLSGNLKWLRFSPDIYNADIHKTAFSAKTYTVLNELLNGL